VFVDMAAPGALAAAIRSTPRERLVELGHRGRQIAAEQYDMSVLRERYLQRYAAIAAAPARLPHHTLARRVSAHLKNALRRPRRWVVELMN
jgi:1,2-diacylglycerol 3-alpha-glucosyltransferase